MIALALLACADTPPGRGPDRGGDTGPAGTAPSDTGGAPTGPPSSEAEVFLNEVVAANATGLTDEAGAYPDWIELYNAGAVAVELGGFALSEEDGWTDQWEFAAGTVIEPGGFLVVFADGDPEEGALHANFKLSAAGETVRLYGREADGRPWLDEAEFPALATDASWARSVDGGPAWGPDATPTPGAANR
jgi:hypothetical protein